MWYKMKANCGEGNAERNLPSGGVMLSLENFDGRRDSSTWTSSLWQPKGSSFARLLEARPDFQIR